MSLVPIQKGGDNGKLEEKQKIILHTLRQRGHNQ